MQNLIEGRSPSKSPTPRPRRPESQIRGSMDPQKRMGSQRSINNVEPFEPPKEDKYRTATNNAHKKNA
jgi:hypothetical protein